jgi:hypothetical protein
MNAALATRLMRPLPKTTARLEREAIACYAKDHGVDFLSTEENYTLVRSALTHLKHHEWYPTIERAALSFVQASRNFLNASGVEQAYPKMDNALLGQLTDKIEQLAKKGTASQYVSRDKVAAFVDIAHKNRELHIESDYDPANIVPLRVYTIARMIVDNFDAYDKTLNS